MTAGPGVLHAFDREVRWSESRGVLQRVAGPAFTVPARVTA